MRIRLVFPPAGDPTRPHLSLPVVQAVLKKRGFSETRLLDANIQAYWHLLDPSRLRVAQEAVERRLSELDSLSSQSAEQGAEYYDLARAAVSAPYVIGHVDEAIGVLRDWKRFVIFKQYAWAIRLLERALMLACAPFYPTRFVFDYKMRLSTKSASEVELALTDPQNLFLSYYAEDVVPRLVASAPDLVVVGISLRSQLIPALTLARLLKAVVPRVHLSAIGVFLHYQEPTLVQWPRLFDFIDSAIPGAFLQYEGGFGEADTVANLARALMRGDGMEKVPGLIYCDEQRHVHHNADGCGIDIETLPTPDFDGLAEEKYFAPETVFPLALTKGCYWGRCTFCTRTDPYEERSTETVFRDMELLQQRYGARSFYFTDDAIRPELFVSLSDRLVDALPGVFWHSMARFDRALDQQACQRMYQAGCRCLEFGLESASARLLKVTKKGTTLEIIRNVLGNCSAAGIRSRVFCIVGFPGETQDEFRATIEFLKDCREIIHSVRIVRFMLEPGSYMAEHPGEFGLTHVIAESGRDLAANLLYEVSAGAGMQDAVRMQAAAIAEIDGIYGGRLAFQTFRQHAFLHAAAGAGAPGKEDGTEQATPVVVPESVLERAIPEGPRRFRYSLTELARSAAESRIERKQAILAGHSHAVQQPEGATRALYPEAKPLAYIYAGEEDAIRELSDPMIRFLDILEPDLSLAQSLRARNLEPAGRALDLANLLVNAGVLRVRHRVRVKG